MVVPIRNRGEAVLIVTRCAETMLIGYLARTALADFLQRQPSICQCLSFVEHHLSTIERILLHKAGEDVGMAGAIPCIEISATDIRRVTPLARS
jgi:hypothetical protein